MEMTSKVEKNPLQASCAQVMDNYQLSWISKVIKLRLITKVIKALM